MTLLEVILIDLAVLYAEMMVVSVVLPCGRLSKRRRNR